MRTHNQGVIMEDAIVPIENEVEPPGFFKKHPDDMNVGDTIIFIGVLTTACVAAPFAVIGVIEGTRSLWTRLQKRNRKSKLKIAETVNVNMN